MEILAIQANEARVRFPAGAAYFAGHFPGQPVVPGVVLIDAAVRIAARATGRPLRLCRLANAKFVQAVGADQEAVFSFSVAPDPARAERLKVSGKWSREGAKIAEMQFTAADEGEPHGP
ncbi:MAG TPA: hypothetical protein P5204_11050 [Kiritimatiellia bacterium]|nr:hypothetical protein [Kiritimatiellia bacterium]